MATEQHAPVWARENAFPRKPESGASFLYGFVDVKGANHPAESLDELVEKVKESRTGVALVWTPDSETLQAPEVVPELRKILWKRRSDWARKDLDDGKRMCVVFGALLLWSLYAGFRNTGGDLAKIFLSPSLGITCILLLMFGFMPLYEGWKILKKGKPSNEGEWMAEADESRFDSWLYRQRVPTTYFLIALMVLSAVAQFLLERGLDWSGQSVARAGLLKGEDAAWWRAITAPYLHGNLLHWFMNAAALLFLGRRVELLARWPHVIIVMFGSAWAGGIATGYFLDAPSVGASGGIMGLLGFLLVFESMHTRLVPKSSRRRLIAGVVVTVLMGVLGFQFIDNAAHAGGLIAGMIYAIIGFPLSKSPNRPAILKQDRWIALGLGGVMVGGLVLVLVKLFS